MTEIIPRVGTDGKSVEIVDQHMAPIAGAAPMSKEDAAFLARGLLSCAAAVAFGQASPGILIGDSHFPTLKWTITNQTATGNPVIIFSIPPGIDLTFQVTPQIEREMGQALINHADALPPPPITRESTH
jgi:hypothetical protein